jgi:hypothetical protein
MRLTDITASNYLNRRAITLKVAPTTRLLLIAGANGTGKTGIAQAIKLAMLGEPTRGLQYKNQLESLITLGERDGAVLVTGDVDGAAIEWRLNLKTGAHTGPPPPGSPLSLDPAMFLALTPADRRKALYAMAGIVMKPEAIKEALVAKGHTAERAGNVVQHLRLGWDAGVKAAKEKATEARGAWKAITGETYGETKAVDWKARVVRPEGAKPITRARDEHAAALEKVTGAKKLLDDLNTAANLHRNNDEAQVAIAALPGYEAELSDALRDEKTATERLEVLQRNSQAHGGDTCACPACGVKLYWDATHKLQEWDKTVVDPVAAHNSLAPAKSEVKLLSANVTNLREKIAAAKAFRTATAALPKKPNPAEIGQAKLDFAKANTDLVIAQSELESAERADSAQMMAQENTERAAAHHADVLAYTALATAVEAMPAEFLSKTLTEFNAYTTKVSSSAGFPKSIIVGEDMEPRYGEILYSLASASQQWRIRLAVGYALAVMGGLRLLVLDEFDMLQPDARGGVLKFLLNTEEVQTVLCATLKAEPGPLSPAMQCVWLAS